MKATLFAIIFILNSMAFQVSAPKVIDLDYEHEVYTYAFSRDGSRLASGGRRGDVRIWDTTTWKEVARFAEKDTSAKIVGLAFSADGRYLAAAWWGNMSFISVWDVAAGVQKTQHTLKKRGFSAAVFSPDLKWCASACYTEELSIWDVKTGQEIQKLYANEGGIVSLAITPAGKRLISGGKDGTLQIWDTAMWKPVNNLKKHPEEIVDLSVSVDGTRLASLSAIDVPWKGTPQMLLNIWDTATGGEVKAVRLTYEARDLALSASAKHIFFIGEYGIFVLDPGSDSKPQSFQGGHYKTINCLALSPDGKTLVTGHGVGLNIWPLSR